MAELREPELLYSENLDSFNRHTESRGFHQKKTICRHRADSNYRPGICPYFKCGYTPLQGSVMLHEHKTIPAFYRLPPKACRSLKPWWDDRAVFQGILRVSDSVLCLVFRDTYSIGVLYDMVANEIIGVALFKVGQAGRGIAGRYLVHQCTVSSDGNFVGILERSGNSEVPREYGIQILGINSSHALDQTDLQYNNGIFEETRIYGKVLYSIRNLTSIDRQSIRIDFIPSYHSSQYLICNVKEFPDLNGNRDDAHLAKMDIRSKDKSALTTFKDRQRETFNRGMNLKNILFARDGELIVACFENSRQTADAKSSSHAIISTATLEILMRLDHDLVINGVRSVGLNLCYTNVTPLISSDGSCIGIPNTAPLSSEDDNRCFRYRRSEVVMVEPADDNFYRPKCLYFDKDLARDRPDELMNVYRVPAVLLPLQSLAKLCIKRATGNNPNRIKQLLLPLKLRRYIYDH